MTVLLGYSCFSIRFFVGLVIVCSGIVNAAPPGGQKPGDFHYRYWDWGHTPKRENYEFALLRLALEKTVASHGEYQVSRTVVPSLSRKRSMREVNRGSDFNLRSGPLVLGDNKGRPAAEINLEVRIPILHNLLGYRRLIVRKQDVQRLSSIATVAEMKKLVLGQGRAWLDMKIYAQNGYRAVDNAELASNLIPMLAKGRFDAVPMSVIETQSLIQGSGNFANAVTELADVSVYYPYPMIFFVSRHRPDLAARLEAGLTLALADGSLLGLLEEHFGEEVRRLKDPSNRFFVLRNAFVPNDITLPEPLFGSSQVVN